MDKKINPATTRITPTKGGAHNSAMLRSTLSLIGACLKHPGEFGFTEDIAEEIFRVASDTAVTLNSNREKTSIHFSLSRRHGTKVSSSTLDAADAASQLAGSGDRGRGYTPNSSDGVVPYWSSHLTGPC